MPERIKIGYILEDNNIQRRKQKLCTREISIFHGTELSFFYRYIKWPEMDRICCRIGYSITKNAMVPNKRNKMKFYSHSYSKWFLIPIQEQEAFHSRNKKEVVQ